MPDQEAIEVALEDLSDVSDSEPSTETTDNPELEQPEQQTADAATEPAKAKSEDSDKQETETKSQRRRRLRREREDKTQAELDRLRAENERLKAKEGKLVQPDPRQYTSEAEYQADLAAFKVRKQDLDSDFERVETDFTVVSSEGDQSFQDAIADFTAEGAEKYNDFADKVINSPLPFTALMVETLMDSDLGADTAYYMAQNPKEVSRIAELPPVAQARAIFELEAKVKDSQKPPQSKAPAPVKPVRGGSSASQTKPVSEMSMSEYAAYRQKQMEAQS